MDAQTQPDVLDTDVGYLELNTRIFGVFADAGKRTLRDLTKTPSYELLGCPNFGSASLDLVRNGLEKHGLCLADDWPPRPGPLEQIEMRLRTIEEKLVVIEDNLDRISRIWRNR